VSWDEALADIGGRIRTAILENRRHEIMYHVGRPGEDGYANRVLQAWGLDGHNSHTNVCSSSARLGHFLWCGNDRPSPDYANAQTILLLSSHLETGHYFNPHAQRIIEGQTNGATLIVIDPRLSNTSAKADCVAARLFGNRGCASAGDGQGAARRRALRPRVRPNLGRLARLSSRGATGASGDVRPLSSAR
jgi:anaerobic selenocysteine-containing dehydrogenase